MYLHKAASGTKCLFIWVPVSQIWSVYEIVGTGRISIPTDNKTTGQKIKSMGPVFTFIKFPKY